MIHWAAPDADRRKSVAVHMGDAAKEITVAINMPGGYMSANLTVEAANDMATALTTMVDEKAGRSS